MQKLRSLFCVLVFTVPAIVLSMDQPLGKLELAFFKREIRRTSIADIEQKIAEDREPKDCPEKGPLRRAIVTTKYYPCLIIKEKFYKADIPQNRLAAGLFNIIAEKEKRDGYRPTPITYEAHGSMFTTKANNYLSDHITYEHNVDENGKYIECTAAFFYKEQLLRAIEQIKNDHARKQSQDDGELSQEQDDGYCSCTLF